MERVKWANNNRKRNPNISYKDPGFIKYYDIDREDFGFLVNKIKQGDILSDYENDRYGWYILAIMESVLENPKFKNNPESERRQLRDQIYYELVLNLKSWKGLSNLYNYAYRIGFCAASHWYNNRNKEIRKSNIIDEHLRTEYEEYYKESINHKINTVNIDER